MYVAPAIELLAEASAKGNLTPFVDLLVAERYPLCCFGLTAEFFFDTSGDVERQQVLVDLAEAYYREAEGTPDLIVGDSRQKKLKSVEQIADFVAREHAGRVTPDRRIFGFYLDAEIGETHLSRYKFAGFADSSVYPYGGSVSYSWPLLTDSGDIERYVERFLSTARATRATYAVGGLALLLETYASSTAETCFPFFKRFPGLVYADSVTFGMARGRNRRAIRDVNWLTAIADDSVVSLGGMARIRSSLSQAVTVTPYDGGVLLRAGPGPVLGDTDRRDLPSLYHQVGQVLRPLRLIEYGASGYLRVPKPFDAAEETRRWLARFD